VLKKYALTIALGFTSLLTIFSLARLNNVPNIGVSFGDKLFHFGAYAVMTWVWFNYINTKKTIKRRKSILISATIAILFGMIIEALQGALTVTRQADINDIIANSIGVLIAVLFLWLLPSKDVKKY